MAARSSFAKFLIEERCYRIRRDFGLPSQLSDSNRNLIQGASVLVLVVLGQGGDDLGTSFALAGAAFGFRLLQIRMLRIAMHFVRWGWSNRFEGIGLHRVGGRWGRRLPIR